MAEFRIPQPEPAQNKTIRFPADVLAGVEKEITGTDCTFSAFVIEAVRTALLSLEEQNNVVDKI